MPFESCIPLLPRCIQHVLPLHQSFSAKWLSPWTHSCRKAPNQHGSIFLTNSSRQTMQSKRVSWSSPSRKFILRTGLSFSTRSPWVVVSVWLFYSSMNIWQSDQLWNHRLLLSFTHGSLRKILGFQMSLSLSGLVHHKALTIYWYYRIQHSAGQQPAPLVDEQTWPNQSPNTSANSAFSTILQDHSMTLTHCSYSVRKNNLTSWLQKTINPTLITPLFYSCTHVALLKTQKWLITD